MKRLIDRYKGYNLRYNACKYTPKTRTKIVDTLFKNGYTVCLKDVIIVIFIPQDNI